MKGYSGLNICVEKLNRKAPFYTGRITKTAQKQCTIQIPNCSFIQSTMDFKSF